MKIYTDNTEFAKNYFENLLTFSKFSTADKRNNYSDKIQQIFDTEDYYLSEIDDYHGWQHIVFKEFSSTSQFDMLIELSKSNTMPDRLICQAGSGKKFHGFRNRPWESLPGNLHLAAFFAPKQEIPNFATGFLILAAVSVFQTIESFPELKGKAKFKWVNDIVVGSSKVCGVIAQTQVMGNEISGAVIGIGLNVEAAPMVEPTAFVAKSSCLNDFSSIFITQKEVFDKLLFFLNINYKNLLRGNYRELLEIYRNNSLIIGKEVKIWSDEQNGDNSIIHKGKVIKIGENLELYLEGQKTAIVRGRLSLAENH